MSRDIEIKELNVSFMNYGRETGVVTDVNARFPEGSITGLIGESGSGKSVLGMSIPRLLPASAKIRGSCLYDGRDLLTLSEKEMKEVRGKEIALIPQNPTESLNPIRMVGRQLVECVTAHEKKGKKEARERRDQLLRRFGFEDPKRINGSYSFEMSGGMNQRVVSALGLMNRPKWVIADEPTKGLDAILRYQVYEVLKDIGKSEVKGMLVITHDIILARALCHRLMVLYKGCVMEQGETKAVLETPMHPYTRGLIGSLPEKGMHPIGRADREKVGCLSGCRFYPRCPWGQERCGKEMPPEARLLDGRTVRCFQYA